MGKKLAQEARRKAGDEELEAAEQKLRTFAVVMAVIVAMGLLGLTLAALCDEDWGGDWPSVCGP
jgi:hypothetical protein